MSKLIIETSDKLHQAFKEYAVKKNKSMKDIVTAYIEKLVGFKKD